MKKNLILALTVAFGVAMAGTAFANHGTTNVGDAASGINSSRHNLSSSGSHFTTLDPAAASRAESVGTSEMCAICHTPHFTDRSAGPLWNRKVQASTAVTSYGELISSDKNTNGALFSTLACMSCHDGVTTLDSVLNRPGKGRGTGGVSWDFWEGGNDVKNFITSTRLNIGDANGTGTDYGAVDLSNDHPIGVIYKGGTNASLRATTTVIGDISMAIDQEDGSMLAALVPNNLWAVKGFISDTATIQMLLRSGTGGATDGAKSYVQCASCHDLHYKNQTNPDAGFVTTYGVTDHTSGKIDGLFLRRVGGNSDSGLCRTCHEK